MTKLKTRLLKDLPIKTTPITDEDYVINSNNGTTKLKVKDITKNVENKVEILEDNLSGFSEQLDNKANKNEIGSPLTATNVSEMTDTTKIYVNTTDGNWYSYNGSNWVIGGVYNSQGLGYKSVDLSKLDSVSEKYKGYKLNSKQEINANYSYFACLFEDETPTNGDNFTVDYEYYIDNDKIVKLETQLFMNDSADINIIDGDNVMLENNHIPMINTRYKKHLVGGSSTGKRYIKLFITLYTNNYIGDVSIYFRNLSVKKGNKELKYILNAPYPPAHRSTIESIEYLGDELVSIVDYLKLKNEMSFNRFTRWKGKKVNFLGDSITEGLHWGSGIKSYPELLKEILGLSEARNYGEGGTMISDGTRSFLNRYNEMDNDADLIIVFGGTNDYSFSTKQFGEVMAYDDTFCGCFRNLLDGLIEKYLGKKIVVLLPLHRANDYIANPTTGKVLHDYRKAMKEICEYMGIAYIDVGAESGMCGHNQKYYEKYMPDTLHLNQEGYYILAEFLANRLEYI